MLRLYPAIPRLFSVVKLPKATVILLAKGNCSFWWDNWTRKGPLCNLLNHQQSSKNIKISDYIETEIWNMPKLMDTIPSHIAKHIQGIKIHEAHKDVPVWTLEDTGKFTCKSAWRSLRKFKTISLTSMKSWHPKLSFKVSFLFYECYQIVYLLMINLLVQNTWLV